MEANLAVASGGTGRFLRRWLIRLSAGFLFVLLPVGQAAAQYGGGGGGGTGTGGMGMGTYTAPKGGYSSATGAAVGAGAAGGAALLFLALHHRGMVTGCVLPAEDGLRLRADNGGKTYALVPEGISVRPGQHVRLKGHKSKTESGGQTFTAHKLVKELGDCDASDSANPGSPAGR